MFYGGDIREAELPWLREQVESMAALAPTDDDGDMPVGAFVISDERAETAFAVPEAKAAMKTTNTGALRAGAQ